MWCFFVFSGADVVEGDKKCVQNKNVLFVHNGPLYKESSGSYFGVHYTDNVVNRYLSLGDVVNFMMRVHPVENPGDQFSRLTSGSLTVTNVPDVLSPAGRLKNARRAREVIKKSVEEADVIVARIPSLIARWAVGYAREMGKPYIVECVACNWDALSNHKWYVKATAPFYFLAQRKVIKEAPFVIYVTKEFLQRRYPTRGESFSISNVELAQPDEKVLQERLERIANRNSQTTPNKLVTVASVSTPYKGQADIIAALKMLKDKGTACEYHLVGDGDPQRLKQAALREGVSELVHFHGAIPHSQVFSILDDMDIYVQPSKQEGLPRAVIEAMSRGMPALGAKTGGIPELLPASRIFPPGDTAEAARILEVMMSTADLRAEAKANFKTSMQYSIEHLERKRQEAFSRFMKADGLKYPEVC